jgi:EPS-associated MarR family transcriptional regulator
MKSNIEQAKILRDLSKNPCISQREIALRNRISLGKVNYGIKSLIEKGYIKLHNFKESENKRKYMYILTPEGMYEKAKQTADFFKWKMEEYARIKKEIEELEEEINGSRMKSPDTRPLEKNTLFVEET